MLDWDAMKKEKALRRKARRDSAEEVFEIAQGLAEDAGMELVQHTPTHYSLINAHEWRLELYPGNQRIYRHKADGWGKAPYLPLKCPWTLFEVVEAARKAVGMAP